MPAKLSLYGIPSSVFTRKVMLFMDEANIEYDLVFTVPRKDTHTAQFLSMNPLGKVPVLVHGELTLPESALICAYLDSLSAEGSGLYPANASDRANALWLEYYAAIKLTPALVPIFYERGIKPRMFGQAPDEYKVQSAIEEQVPPVYDHLESLCGSPTWFEGDSLSIVDIAISSPLISCHFVGFTPDENRWPKLNTFLHNMLERPTVSKLLASEAPFWQT
jgi:glutathione S-transferase